LDDPDGPARIQQVMHSEQVSPALRRVLRSPQVLDVVEQLLGPEISLFHSKLLPKAARAGTAIPWHQDYAYWRTETNEPLMVNCQIAIDEAVLENGCIQFVPGSHTRGLVDHETKGGTFGIFITEPDEQRDDAVAVEMAPGDVVFFSCLVAHGSDENRSDRDRCMNTFVYNAPGNDPDTCREVLRGQ
jgi:ectoine hydroxylase-related dioxygenase (phytanoyl-CoA dioxygenase family)